MKVKNISGNIFVSSLGEMKPNEVGEIPPCLFSPLLHEVVEEKEGPKKKQEKK